MSCGSNRRAAAKSKRRGPLFGVVSKTGELSTFVSNQEAIESGKNVTPVLVPYKSFYDALHDAGYHVDVTRRLASSDPLALARYCRKLPAGAYFNGHRIVTPRQDIKTVDDQDTIEEMLEEQAAAVEERITRRATIADHVQTLLPKSRREL